MRRRFCEAMERVEDSQVPEVDAVPMNLRECEDSDGSGTLQLDPSQPEAGQPETSQAEATADEATEVEGRAPEADEGRGRRMRGEES